MKVLTYLLGLPFLLALGLALHALCARGVKTVLWASSPLATGEHESHTYERRVYHTADAKVLQVIGVATAAGALWWVGWVVGSSWFHVLGAIVLIGAVALDLLRWERVSVTGSHLWFQRGYFGRVHQIDTENILDVSVEETEVGGFTLRHGRHNRVVRLMVRMADRRVVALPKTDPDRGLDAVEDVANQVRVRLHHRTSRRQAMTAEERRLRAQQAEDAVVKRDDDEDDDLRRTLRRLREGRKPTVPAELDQPPP